MAMKGFTLWRGHKDNRTPYVGAGDCPWCSRPITLEADVANTPGTDQRYFEGVMLPTQVAPEKAPKPKAQAARTDELALGEPLPFDDGLPDFVTGEAR